VVLAIHLRLGDDEDIVQEEFAKLGDMMALPIIDT
jgi:hypothetical protein